MNLRPVLGRPCPFLARPVAHAKTWDFLFRPGHLLGDSRQRGVLCGAPNWGGFHPACHTAELSMFSKTPEMLTFIKDSNFP